MYQEIEMVLRLLEKESIGICSRFATKASESNTIVKYSVKIAKELFCPRLDKSLNLGSYRIN